MATTDRSTPEGEAFRRDITRLAGSRRRFCRRVVAAALLASCCGAGPALAQRVSVDAGIASNATWTSNSLIGLSTPQSDTVFDVRPHFTIRADGARLKLSGTAALDAVTYARGSLPSRLLPTADLTARLEAVQRLLYLETELRATRTSENPFGARSETASGSNTLTTTQLRVSPYIDATAGPGLRYRVRSDNIRTSESGRTLSQDAPSASGYFGHHTASIEQDPRTIGWRLEIERSETRYNDSVQPAVIIDLARASVNYAASDDLSFGVRGGPERNSLLGDKRNHTIAGVQMKWQPSERTLLTGFGERRFFGNSWHVAFDHRSPHIAWNMLFARGIDTAPQGLFELPATNNVAALLDAMFTTRIPDPVERARKVQEFINLQGLPGQTLQATNIYSQRLSLATTGNATVTWIGVRNSLALSAYYSRSQDAPDAGLLATGRPINNNTQIGASVAFSHRLSAVSSLSVTVDASRIRALESIAVDQTKQAGVRASVSTQLAPKTTLVFGAGYSKLGSNVTVGGQQSALFVGMDHGF